MSTYDKRRAALMRELNADAFLVVNLEGSDEPSLRYLTGFTGEGALLLSSKEPLLLTDSRYTEQAGREVPDLPLSPVKGEYVAAVAAAVKERGIRRVAFASRRTSHYWVEKLRRRRSLRLVSREDPVARLRAVKDREEVARIRKATALTEAALDELLGTIRVGMTEEELALDLEWRIRKRGAQKVAFDLIVAAGENSALPHYRPGRRPLESGDLLLVNIGARLGGYCCDLTRVFAVGKASKEAQELYRLVLAANRAGVAAIRAGAAAKEVDAAARNVIASAGHGNHFGHGLGHGVGLEVHEGPHLSPRDTETLEAGMVVTVEPGVYLPGYGGVRIEDLVLVTEGGRHVLTGFPRDRLIVVG